MRIKTLLIIITSLFLMFLASSCVSVDRKSSLNADAFSDRNNTASNKVYSSIENYSHSYDNDSPGENTSQNAILSDGTWKTRTFVGFDFDASGTKDDIVEAQYTLDEDENNLVIINVVIENETVYSCKYGGSWYPTVYGGDLLHVGTDSIIVWLLNATSNYSASQVHVLHIQDNQLVEVLTILDCPETYSADYLASFLSSLFIIPEPENHFGLSGNVDSNYATFCTGVELIEVFVQGLPVNALKISHAIRDQFPYTIIYYSNSQWIIFDQNHDVEY